MSVEKLTIIFLASISCLLITVQAQASNTRLFIDDLGREVRIPLQAKRVASLHDSVLTIPLIELGTLPVGSHGRVTKQGKAFIRGSKGLTGYDFDNSDIAFLGSHPIDIESIVKVKPDLIITTPWQKASLQQLQAIAPTVVIDFSMRSRTEIFQVLAEIVNQQQQFAILQQRYQTQIARIKRIIDTQNTTVNVLQADKGKILVWHTYFNLGTVLRDAGFKFPALVDNIQPGKKASYSAESLQQLDADYLFVTYRSDNFDRPKDAIDGLEAVFPSFCAYLQACKQGRMLIMPREEAAANSFNALVITAYNVLTHISGRPYIKP